MAWGGSIGQVAQNEIVLSAAQRAAAERQLEMLIRQQEAARNNAQENRQLDQRDTSQAEQTRQFDERMKADAAQETRLGGQYDRNLALQRDQIHERQRDRRMDMMQRRRVFTMNEQDKALRSLLPHAAAMADEGMFENIEDVIKQFPSLASQAPQLAGRSSAARRAIEGELSADTADAALLNEGPSRVARLNHMAAMEKESSWDSDRNHWWRPDEPDTDAINAWRGEAGQVSSAMAGVRGSRGAMGRLTPDATGRYAPNTTLPWRPSGTSTATNPAPAAPRPQSSAQQFKPGMMVIQNGTTYRFDGQNWLPLQ